MKKDFATFLTYSGIEIDIQNVKEEDVNVNDIFHSLSLINRFCGQSRRAYSVAEHSIYCYIIADLLGFDNRIKAYALLHDASESMIGDMPTYVKQFLPKYKEIENKVESVIFSKLDLGDMTDDEKDIVKRIDNTMMLLEMRDLTQHDISQINLIERKNYYSEFTQVKEKGLVVTAYGRRVKDLIDLEFGDIMEHLGDDYAKTFWKYNDDYALAHENIMKHIYKNEFSNLLGVQL